MLYILYHIVPSLSKWNVVLKFQAYRVGKGNERDVKGLSFSSFICRATYSEGVYLIQNFQL